MSYQKRFYLTGSINAPTSRTPTASSVSGCNPE